MRIINVYEVMIVDYEEGDKTLVGTITVDDDDIVTENNASEKVPSILPGQLIQSEEIYVAKYS